MPGAPKLTMSSAPAHSTNPIGRSRLSSATTSDAPSTLRPTFRTTNAVFALPTSQQQRTRSWQALVTAAHDNGGGLTGGPVAHKMRLPFSGEQCGSVSKSGEPAAAAAATMSVSQKRSLGEGARDQRTEGRYAKRQRQSGGQVGVNHDVAPPRPQPPQLQQQQKQQQQVGALKPPQKASAPYQATSVAGRVWEAGREKGSRWEGSKGENSGNLGKGSDGGPITNSSEGSWGGTTASPSLPTTDGHAVGGGSSPPSSSFSSSPGGRMAPTGEGLPEESRASVSHQYTNRMYDEHSKDYVLGSFSSQSYTTVAEVCHFLLCSA